MMNRREFVAASAAALLAGSAGNAFAQEFPTRPVTMIVPFAAGGAGDILARALGAKIEPIWGKPMVVENKGGAGGVIGALATAKAEPDGYTLMIAPSATMAVNVSLFKTLPYDPVTDFVPIALAAQTPFVLVVNPDIPVKSIPDLIAYAKDKGSNLSYATAGPGVPHHLFGELLKSMLGIEMIPVAYRGSLPALNDVVAGHVPLMFVDLGPAMGIIQAGKVRPIGISTKQRFAGLPDVPPLAEAGVPGFDAASWQMVVAPGKTPPALVEKLHGDFKRVLDMPDTKELILKNGMLPAANTSVADLQGFIKSEIARWSKVVAQAGLTASQ
jgi:tripartite-type tricarboxylate transporter receptor subunit TctC